MKKRLLCTILILVMMFGVTVPSYAEAWSSEQAYQTNQGVRSLVSLVTNIYSLLQTNFGASGDIALMGENIAKLVSWFAPDGYKPDDYHSLWEICLDMGTALYQYLPSIPTIANYVSSWMATNNTYLDAIRKANINGYYVYSDAQSAFDYRKAFENAHSDLWGNSVSSVNQYAWYNIPIVRKGTSPNLNNNVRWTNGTPIGNVVASLQRIATNQAYSYWYLYDDMLEDFTGQLGIWDSQGETLTQEGWSPTSAINGLYKYLAYTQRDVARLTYVLASDEEITAREKARENQEAVLDDFIDPEGSGSVSTSNFGDIASASDNFKDNMNTGVSASGIFDVFTGDHTSEWFSTETANELNNVGSGSRSRKAATPQPTYETPLLDAKMTELLDIFGGDGE